MDLTATLAAALVVAISLALISRRWKRWQAIEKFPGKLALPILGTSYELLFKKREGLLIVFDRNVNRFRPIFRTWLGSKPEIHILTAENVEKIMTSSELITKSDIYTFLKPWLGEGLLISTGAKWHSRRKMMTPAFHFQILDKFIDVFAEQSEILVGLLKNKANGQCFDMYPFLTRCALDIICETAMGTKVNAQTRSDSEYVSAVYRVAEITVNRGLKPWLHSDYIFKMTAMGKQFYKDLEVLQGFTRKVIRERKTLVEANGSSGEKRDSEQLGIKRRVAFLDLLLEASGSAGNKPKLTDQELQEEVDTFMFEGHDTTSVGMAWVLILLGNHRDVQEKVYAELDDIFKDDPSRHPTMQDLNNMKYLERVIKEALRLYPSVPFIGRQVTEEVEVAGRRVPKGTALMLHIRHIHRDPNHWPNPERFDPDNFLPERVQNRHPFAFVPFSAGPRNCIGQKFAILEEKMVLSYLLRHFRVQAVERLEDLKLVAELVLRPLNGVQVRLTPR